MIRDLVLPELVEGHKFWWNAYRVNLDTDPEHHRVDRNGRTWLRNDLAPYSNTLRSGPILDYVRTELPGVNAVCLNRKRAESPPMSRHRDGKNSGPSWVMFWGDYPEGEGCLCLEDGTVYSEKHVWHGPMDGAKVAHWVTPHTSGVRYSAVAFSGPPAPKTRG